MNRHIARYIYKCKSAGLPNSVILDRVRIRARIPGSVFSPFIACAGAQMSWAALWYPELKGSI